MARRTVLGDATSDGAMALEFMLVITAVIVVFLVMLQYAARAHAHRIATAAAEEGLMRRLGL